MRYQLMILRLDQNVEKYDQFHLYSVIAKRLWILQPSDLDPGYSTH